MQFWSGFIPINGGGWIYISITAISPTPTLHLTRFMASSFSKPTLLLSFSTLHLPCLIWSSSLPLALHFKLQRFSQNMPIIPPQHTPVPFHSIRLCHLNHGLLPSIPTSPLGPLSSYNFSTSVLHHTLLLLPVKNRQVEVSNICPWRAITLSLISSSDEELYTLAMCFFIVMICCTYLTDNYFKPGFLCF